MLTINNFNRAISSIQEDEFDSHKFIKHYINECEHEYISMLIENFNNYEDKRSNGFNSQNDATRGKQAD